MDSDGEAPDAARDEVPPHRITVPSVSVAALTAPIQSALSAYAAAMPKIDFTQFQPAFDVARLMPKIDTGALVRSPTSRACFRTSSGPWSQRLTSPLRCRNPSST